MALTLFLCAFLLLIAAGIWLSVQIIVMWVVSWRALEDYINGKQAEHQLFIQLLKEKQNDRNHNS